MKAAIYARVSDGRHQDATNQLAQLKSSVAIAARYDWQVQHAYEWPYADRNILISWRHFRWWKEIGKE